MSSKKQICVTEISEKSALKNGENSKTASLNSNLELLAKKSAGVS